MTTTSLTSTSTAMPGQLETRSDAGAKLAAAVDELAPSFAERNRRRDREGEPALGRGRSRGSRRAERSEPLTARLPPRQQN